MWLGEVLGRTQLGLERILIQLSDANLGLDRQTDQHPSGGQFANGQSLVSEVCPPVSGCGCAKSRTLVGEGCGWEAVESRLPA